MERVEAIYVALLIIFVMIIIIHMWLFAPFHNMTKIANKRLTQMDKYVDEYLKNASMEKAILATSAIADSAVKSISEDPHTLNDKAEGYMIPDMDRQLMLQLKGR